ncbi:MAG TPA: LamG-like jellyroll fold domain-containing protein [Verrucomicrobiae bacterium]|jgi:hypothetical protein
MKRKLLLSSAVIPAVLMASGAMGQVVNFHDSSNGQLAFPGVGYDELFAGQGAYSDPGNNIWNGFGFEAGYRSTYYYSGGINGSAPWPQQAGNPGNPYAAYNGGGGWMSSHGPSLFDFSSGSTSASGDSTSGGVFTPITLSVGGYAGDNGIGNIGASAVPNGSPSFLLGEAAVANGATPNEVFTLHNVPAGTYGLYLYAANEGNNRGTSFAVNSGNAHNGITATLNSQSGTPAQTFSEGQNFVIFENVTPNGSGNIVITASPNAQDGVGNSNLGGETDVNGFQLIFNPPPAAVNSTVAQNVYTGDPASFSFSPAFAAGATFRWQFVKNGVTNNLTDTAPYTGTATTNLVIAQATAAIAGLYQCLMTTATASNTSPAAPLTILSSTASSALQNGDSVLVTGYILQLGDVLSDANNNLNLPYNSIPPIFDMSVTNAEDNTLYQYVNLGSDGSSAPFVGPVSFTVTPRFGATVATGVRFYASSSHPEDDPADFLISGSDDGGATFTPIAGGTLSLPAARNAAGGALNLTNDVLQEVNFPNGTAYTTYQVTFTNVNNDSLASNGVQLAEVQLLGSLPAVAPAILAAPNANNVQLTGSTLNTSISIAGPGPLTYQWSFNSTAIAGATNSSFSVANLQATNAGNYSVVVTSPYGSTNATLGLTVVAPTPYQQALLAYNPLGYWPLNETSGTVAYDVTGGHNGNYIQSPGLGQPGVPFAGFGPSSASVFFAGGSSVDVPEGPFNITGPITVMAWVQINPGITAFMNIIGHGDSSYRTTVNNNSSEPLPGFNDGGDNNGDATALNPLSFGAWHFVVGVFQGGSASTPNGFVYVDGTEVASNEITSVAGNLLDVLIGGAPDYNNRFFVGDIAHAAILSQALTLNQVDAIYNAAEPPPTVTVTNSVTVNENGNTSIASSISGGEPIFYQWYFDNGGNNFAIAGATNSTLQLTNVQQVQQNYQYFVIVSNAFGMATSSPVSLTVLASAPSIVNDISPLFQQVPVGVPVTLSVVVTGSQPFRYQWSNGVVAIPGATNSIYTFNALPGMNSYSVGISNSAGSTPSSTAIVAGVTNAPSAISFAGNGVGWALNMGATITPSFSNNVLTMTDNKGSESSSAFYETAQYVGGFVASFTYQETSANPADGLTFTLQNSGANATGGGGGELGYVGITNSAALEFNIYSGDHGGAGITLGTNGNVPSTDTALGNFISTTPVNLSSQHAINVLLSYSQDELNVWLTDPATTNSYHASFDIDIPAAVGGDTAFVGFTAATGGLEASQTISNFSFSSSVAGPLSLTIQRGANGTVVLTWPVFAASTLVLQQSTDLINWSNVATAPQNVNLQNQVTLTPGGAATFYRLALE